MDEFLSRIIEENRNKPGGLSNILHAIQLRYRYLPQDLLHAVAAQTSYTMLDIYAIATSSPSYRLQPPELGASGNAKPSTIRCPRCNHSLMDSKQLLGGLPSVRLTASFAMEHGWLRISLRSDDYQSEHPIPDTGKVSVFCPHCHVELWPPMNCATCGAPILPAVADDGSFTGICSSARCPSRTSDASASHYKQSTAAF